MVTMAKVEMSEGLLKELLNRLDAPTITVFADKTSDTKQRVVIPADVKFKTEPFLCR